MLSPEEKLEKSRAYQREYYRQNAQRLRKTHLNYYYANRERCLAKQKAYGMTLVPSEDGQMVTRNQAYYAKNREARKAYSKAYYDENREACIAGSKRWRKANPEKSRQISHAYWENNKERLSEKTQQRRAANRQKLYASQSVPRDLRMALGWTQAKTAAYFGVSQPAWCNYERGFLPCDLDKLVTALQEVLDGM